eukprot:c55205_g1_i1.p3 GENE.c55205_g1_i1~~c55205_g1_i1.p3  ORF type:complete len:120 (+),score=6.49 c55205_g1_i1:104-463(+)
MAARSDAGVAADPVALCAMLSDSTLALWLRRALRRADGGLLGRVALGLVRRAGLDALAAALLGGEAKYASCSICASRSGYASSSTPIRATSIVKAAVGMRSPSRFKRSKSDNARAFGAT